MIYKYNIHYEVYDILTLTSKANIYYNYDINFRINNSKNINKIINIIKKDYQLAEDENIRLLDFKLLKSAHGWISKN